MPELNEIPVSWFTVDELLAMQRFAAMLPYQVARIAWTYEQQAYRFGKIEQQKGTDFDWCSRYEALKASRLYELAEALR